jgi:hypothetical protein
MSLSIAEIYSVRFGAKLALPKIIQDNIAKLRMSPTTYRPNRPAQRPQAAPQYRPNTAASAENWREKKLADYVRRLKETDDPDYGKIMSAFNKITAATLDKLSTDITTIIRGRDEQFRLRVSALLFDKAIVQHAFSATMADCAKILSYSVPEISDDLRVQIEMFPELYNIDKTLMFPSSSDPDYAEKLIQVFKQKDKRRGYAKFVTQLYVRGMVSELTIRASLTNVIDDMLDMAKKPVNKQIDENVSQFVDFMFETATALPKTAHTLRGCIKTLGASILAMPRAELPNLSMRSRFRFEDVVKCVQ